MPPTRKNRENNQSNNMHSFRGKQNRGKKHNRKFRFMGSYEPFHFYNNYNNYQPYRKYYHGRKYFTNKNLQSSQKKASRPPSPFSGTEEYTMRKIQETSDMIKKRLMMPPEDDETVEQTQKTQISDLNKESESENTCTKNQSQRTKVAKKAALYNVEEIHNKIISHITNLSHARKMNLISSSSSGYDIAIRQIQTQKRLELSKVLRDMCSNQTVENSEVINAIIPDIGIKIEDLPLEVIKALSSTLDLNFENSLFSQDVETGPIDAIQALSSTSDLNFDSLYLQNVKTEPCEMTVSGFDLNFDNPVTTQNINTEVCKNAGSCYDSFIHYTEDLDEDNKDEVSSDKIVNCSMDQTNDVEVNIKQEIKSEEIVLKPDFNFIHDNPNYISQTNENDLNNVNFTKNCSLNESISVESQTDSIDVCSTESQTDINSNHNPSTSYTDMNSNHNSQLKIKNNIDNLNDAVEAMFQIDKEIARLTKLRRSIFVKLNKSNRNSRLENSRSVIKKGKKNKQQSSKRKVDQHVSKTKAKKDEATSFRKENWYKEPLGFELAAEKILVMKMVEDTLLAASETGRIFYINTTSGKREATLQVSQVPITSLCYLKVSPKQSHLFVGSYEGFLREYHYNSRSLFKIIEIGECIQCLEHAWECVFIGTTSGRLKRYSLKRNVIEFDDMISSDSVLVLKATQEGARRVLLVGSRNAPVCVRDAMSGLRLRELGGCVTPTVYSLLLENSMIYCGTTFHDVLVIRFHDGDLIHKHQASNSKGIGCMKVVDNLLFAGCYDGNIYVYNTKTHKYVGVIDAAGGVILSMEILKNMVIVGTMSLNFKSILIPDYILESNAI